MTVTVYAFPLSPPCRTVEITAKILGVPYDVETVNIAKGEQLQPEFLKLNPLNTIPVIKDDDFVLFDSHAILLYLIAKYAKDDSLFPKDLEQQATVRQRLCFSDHTLFSRFKEATVSMMTTGSVANDLMAKATEALNQLETLLGDNEWVAGTPNFSVADISLLSILENWTVTMPGTIDSHDKIVSWLHRGRDLIPEFEALTRPAMRELSKVFGGGSE